MFLFIRFLIFAILAYILVKALRKALSGASTHHQKARRPHKAQSQRNRDPHEVLGVSRNASPEEIKSAYRNALTKYHPDKVNHLGEELQQLAREKTQEIKQAYEQMVYHENIY